MIWAAVASIIIGLAVYVWILKNSDEAQQVRRLKQELDSITDRGYQLQHKIDSLNQLGVADVNQQEDSTSIPSDNVSTPSSQK